MSENLSIYDHEDEGQSIINISSCTINSDKKINPWLNIWLKPKQTIRYLLQDDPSLSTIALGLLWGINYVLNQIERVDISKYSLSQIFCSSLVWGPVAGVLSLLVSALLFLWIGKLFKGKAQYTELLTAIAWSSAPVIMVSLPLQIILTISNKTIWAESLADSSNPVFQAIAIVIALLTFIPFIWQFFTLIKVISEVQNIQWWKSTLNTIIVGILYLIIIMAGILILGYLAKVFPFVYALFLGVNLLTFPEVWTSTFVCGLIYLAFTVLIGTLMNKSNSSAGGCLGMLVWMFGGFVLQGIITAALVAFLIPLYFSTKHTVDISLVLNNFQQIALIGVGASFTVLCMTFIPMLGPFIASSRASQFYLEGVIAVNYFLGSFLSRELHKIHSTASVEPNWIEYVAFAIIAGVLEYVLIIGMSFCQVLLQKRSTSTGFNEIVTMLSSPTVGMVAGLVGVFMYISYIKISFFNLIHH